MKIIHVLPGFLPDNVAGTEVYCWSLCKCLQAVGIETEVVIPGFGQEQTSHYIYDGIKVTRYAEPTVQTRLHILGLALPDGIQAFAAYILSAKPDCVHFHGIYAGIGITVEHIAKVKEMGIPVIYTMHLPGHVCATETLVYKDRELCDGIIRPFRCATCNLVHQGNKESVANIMAGMGTVLQKIGIDAGKWNSSLGTGLSYVNRIRDMQDKLERLATLCDKVVLCGQWFREILIANGFPAERTEFIPTGLTVTGEQVQAPALAFHSQKSIKLIFVGRIHPLKGVDLLLQAFNGLPEDRIELSIYGKSSDQAFYDRCRRSSEGKKNIHWRGLLAREDLMAVFRQHDMLCLPSTFSEMSPLVIQEAFAAGLPVLASKVYGNAEQVQHNRNGLLFTFKSADSLHQELERLLDEATLLPALKAAVSSPLSFDTVAAHYLTIYRKLKTVNPQPAGL